MTELEKQRNGLPYDGADAQLKTMQYKAQNLVKQINSLDMEEEEKRTRLLKTLFGGVGKNIRVYPPIYVDFGCNIFTGNNVFINQGCTFLDTNTITIGDRVLIAPNVKVYAGDHPLDGKQRYYDIGDGNAYIETYSKPVKIGNDVWIGGGAIILPGITVGNNVVIGAGSVVTRDIEDNVVVGGNPAKVIRRLTAE